MPLTSHVRFSAVLQSGDRVQVPWLVRRHFGVEPGQVLAVEVRPSGSLASSQVFYARLTGDGRVTIPKLQLRLLREEVGCEVGCVLDVHLGPGSGA